MSFFNFNWAERVGHKKDVEQEARANGDHVGHIEPHSARHPVSKNVVPLDASEEDWPKIREQIYQDETAPENPIKNMRDGANIRHALRDENGNPESSQVNKKGSGWGTRWL